MNRKASSTYSTKKRRLESEQSQISGITTMSNVTQTTELSSDYEDNISDSSSSNVYHGSSSNAIDFVQTKGNKSAERNVRRAQRKRQVSWSLYNEVEDETFLKESRLHEIPVPYDNNFDGTNNNSRRTRRATESSIDTHVCSNVQTGLVRSPDSQHNQLASPLRSNTTSQIHGHEDDIQRQRMWQGLVREHDARNMNDGRSQSVTSLRDPNHLVRPFCGGDTHFQTPSHTYEPLQHRTVPSTPHRPVETVVTMPNGGPNYLHPVIQVQRAQRNGSFDVLNNITPVPRNDNQSLTDDSGYAVFNRCSESSTTSQTHGFCCHGYSSTFFRKGFYVLLVLNVIFVLLNVVGLPFLYVAMKQDYISDSPSVGAQTSSNICVECEALTSTERKLFQTSSEENQCCGSVEKIFPALLKTSIKRSEQKLYDLLTQEKTAAKFPVVQLKASDEDMQSGNELKIVWDERNINTMDAKIAGKTNVIVEKPGYYYIYSRVHYKKPKGSNSSEFTIGHKVMKQESNSTINPKPIDSVEQRCFPSNTSGDVRHTNHLGSVQYLKKGDILFVELDHKQYFDHENTIFGMFLVST